MSNRSFEEDFAHLKPPPTSAPGGGVAPFEKSYSRRSRFLAGLATAVLLLGIVAAMAFPGVWAVIQAFLIAAVFIGGIMLVYALFLFIIGELFDHD